MRRPRVEARALIARLKVHGVAFDSARRAVVFIDSDAWHRTAEIGTVCRFASADSLRMGDGPVTEWISWPLRTEQAYRAAVLRNDALRVVLEWLRCELPWCLTWAPVLGSLHRWQQASTPNRLRRYEGAAHAERCSRPTAPPSYPLPIRTVSSQLVGVYLAGMHHLATMIVATCGRLDPPVLAQRQDVVRAAGVPSHRRAHEVR